MSIPPGDPETPATALPAARAFVLQIARRAAIDGGSLAGRIEHVTSGRACHFASTEELLRFVLAMLGDQPAGHRNEP
jgi:hypothetical protein